MLRNKFDGDDGGDDDYDDNDYDDNGKQSKIQRDSKSFITKAIFLMAALTIFALGLGYVHTHQPPQLAVDINKMVIAAETTRTQQQQQQQQHQHQMEEEEEEEEEDDDSKPFDEEVDLELAAKVDDLDKQVRARKKTADVIMETDEQGLELTKKLQEATLKLLEHRYGANVHPPNNNNNNNNNGRQFRVVVDVIYPHSIIKDPDSESTKGQFTIEMAPVHLIPCSVFYFLELVRTYKGGGFHRNAGHVLQANAQSDATEGHKSMPFQEYSPEHPHAKYTTGYAGRPSGPEWYVSIQDNTNNHGPGSQQKKNPYEADSNFGRIVDGVESGVIAKIHSVPQNGWLDKNNCIKMVKMTIMVNTKYHPDNDDDDDDDNNNVDNDEDQQWTEWIWPK